MHRRSFLGALLAAPVVVPVAAKALAAEHPAAGVDLSKYASLEISDAYGWSVRLDQKGCVAGLKLVDADVDNFYMVAPGEEPIGALKVKGDRIVPNPEFPWTEYFGG